MIKNKLLSYVSFFVLSTVLFTSTTNVIAMMSEENDPSAAEHIYVSQKLEDINNRLDNPPSFFTKPLLSNEQEKDIPLKQLHDYLFSEGGSCSDLLNRLAIWRNATLLFPTKWDFSNRRLLVDRLLSGSPEQIEDIAALLSAHDRYNKASRFEGGTQYFVKTLLSGKPEQVSVIKAQSTLLFPTKWNFSDRERLVHHLLSGSPEQIEDIAALLSAHDKYNTTYDFDASTEDFAKALLSGKPGQVSVIKAQSTLLFPTKWNFLNRRLLVGHLLSGSPEQIEDIAALLSAHDKYNKTCDFDAETEKFVKALLSGKPEQVSVIKAQSTLLFPTKWDFSNRRLLVDRLLSGSPEQIEDIAALLSAHDRYNKASCFEGGTQYFVKTLLSGKPEQVSVIKAQSTLLFPTKWNFSDRERLVHHLLSGSPEQIEDIAALLSAHDKYNTTYDFDASTEDFAKALLSGKPEQVSVIKAQSTLLFPTKWNFLNRRLLVGHLLSGSPEQIEDIAALLSTHDKYNKTCDFDEETEKFVKVLLSGTPEQIHAIRVHEKDLFIQNWEFARKAIFIHYIYQLTKQQIEQVVSEFKAKPSLDFSKILDKIEEIKKNSIASVR